MSELQQKPRSWWDRTNQSVALVAGIATVVALLFAYSQRRPTGDLQVIAQLVPYYEIPDSAGRTARDVWAEYQLLSSPSSLWIVGVRNGGSAPAQAVSLVLTQAALAEITQDGRTSFQRVTADRIPLGALMPGDAVTVRAWGNAIPELVGRTARAYAYSADGEARVRLIRPLSELDYRISRTARFLFGGLLVLGLSALLAVVVTNALLFPHERARRRPKNPPQ